MSATSGKKMGFASLDTLNALSSKQQILDIHCKKHHLSKEQAEKLWLKYLEYMVIKARYMDSASQMKFSTSPEVDELWHTHLLNTESYLELMNLVNDINPLVSFIHHSEQNAEDLEVEKKARRQAAAKAYKETFGKDCKWFEEHWESASGPYDDDTERDDATSCQVLVFIKTLTGRTIEVFIQLHRTVKFLKGLIKDKEGIPTDQLRLFFKNIKMEDGLSLAHYNVQKNSTILLVLHLVGC